MSATDRILLPTNVRPSRYLVKLTPNFDDFTFRGSEEIQVEVKQATKQITIHSKDIKIFSVEFVGAGASEKATNISFDEKEETVTFDFAKDLPVGKATLKIDFQGNLNDEMCGFYRSKYFVDGQQRWAGVTQFEATDARRAFPCWDEPAVKAIFDIELTVPINRVALSNMPPISETRDEANGTKTIRFDASPIMSTYLVAFVVGEYDFVEDVTKEGVKVRVYTPLGLSAQGKFALSVGVKTLSYFSDFFGIPYPLPKQDMIAISDFAAGAMENWGLITYRENALLIDEANSSLSSKQRVAYVVAHELAHQWFGNFTTMEWWSQLWLNEGFATFVGTMATDYLFPEWNVWTVFASDYQSTAFGLDGLKSSHPIEVEVRSSAQISEIFDMISYHKGACVIRMLEAVLGQEHFKKGLNRYLNKHAYTNANTQDLWAALSQQSGVDVKGFMDNYTKLTGYPVVTIRETATEGTFEVEQTRFLSTGESTESDPSSWVVHLNLISASSSKQSQTHSFSGRKDTITKVEAKKGDWVKVNAAQSGFYRVRYSSELLNRLREPIQSLKLAPVDRLGIQSDAFALAKAGLLPTSQALDIALSYTNETDYTVWKDLDANIGDLSAVWISEATYPKLQNFILKLYEKIGEKMGWEPKAGEPDTTVLLRSLVLRRLGINGHTATVNEAKARFNKFLEDPSSLRADLRGAVYEIVAVTGGDKEQNALFELYKKSDMQEEKNRILRTVAHSHDPNAVRRGLEFSLSGVVRDQDLMYPYVITHQTPAGRDVAWDFFRERWNEYFTKLSKSMLLSRIVGWASEHFTTEEKAKEVEEFFAKNSAPSAERRIKQALETIRLNTAWLNRSRQDVADWLSKL